jgi:hypothetical protein
MLLAPERCTSYELCFYVGKAASAKVFEPKMYQRDQCNTLWAHVGGTRWFLCSTHDEAQRGLDLSAVVEGFLARFIVYQMLFVAGIHRGFCMCIWRECPFQHFYRCPLRLRRLSKTIGSFRGWDNTPAQHGHNTDVLTIQMNSRC